MFLIRNPYKKQLERVLGWLGGVVSPDDRILITINGHHQKVVRFEFPVRHGDKPVHAGKHITNPDLITFKIQIGTPSKALPDREWRTIFASDIFTISERRRRPKYPALFLNRQLSPEESLELFVLARKTCALYFEKRIDPRALFGGLPFFFQLKADVGVALWKDGRLRGSTIIKNYSIQEGILEATIYSLQDRRFKPLGHNELNETRIQITLIHPLRIPLTREEIKRNIPYFDKAYVLETKNQKAWFLPEIFNIRECSSLVSLKRQLFAKAGVNETRSGAVSIASVNDYIEGPSRDCIITMRGPIAARKTDNADAAARLLRAELRSALDCGARWLCRLQEDDGNIPCIIHPSRGITRHIDWPRLAFVGRALAAYGIAVKNQKYQDSARKILHYLNQSLARISYLTHNPLTHIYTAQLAAECGEENTAKKYADGIRKKLPNVPFRPILYAQAVPLLEKYTRDSVAAQTVLGELVGQFNRTEHSYNIVSWAECAVVCSTQKKYARISELLKNNMALCQRPDGSFVQDGYMNIPYTRGTGKLFEVLANFAPQYPQETIRAFHWLRSMQYDDANMFHIPSDAQPYFLGSLRHDYGDREAWIDAVGHLLLGGARLLGAQEDSILS